MAGVSIVVSFLLAVATRFPIIAVVLSVRQDVLDKHQLLLIFNLGDESVVITLDIEDSAISA